jgi:rhodanese-related sulfurtransferase
MSQFVFPSITAQAVREQLLAGTEIAILDVREQAAHGAGHPLFAANLPLDRIEVAAYSLLPRRDVQIVVFDNGEGYALRAANLLVDLGFSQVGLLKDGMQGWIDAGYQVFIDVNGPSKGFGELVEIARHTPSLSAQEVQRLIDERADYIIVDSRRFEEYQTLSIPTAISVPGAELVLRIRELAPRPETQVIVNCAGRTRSIIGAQSLINAGIPNPVAALRNGAIGWKLAKQKLDTGANRRYSEVSGETRSIAARDARLLADRAGVKRITIPAVNEIVSKSERTVYLLDVRDPAEYVRGHLPGFLSAPGGQLVQETDMVAAVRGAIIVLADNDGVRANMTASWLAQMAWDVAVLDGTAEADFSERGTPQLVPPLPELPAGVHLTAEAVSDLLAKDPTAAILDFSPSVVYKRRHIPGAWYAARLALQEALLRTGNAERYVLTSQDGLLPLFVFSEFQAATSRPVLILHGGNDAWHAAGHSLTTDGSRFASTPRDRCTRSFEKTEDAEAAMQGYIDWELDLVRQLELDGTHGFRVL